MSWSRFASDDPVKFPWGPSDIYTFPSHGGATCCACPLREYASDEAAFRPSFFAATLDDFLAHIAEHVEARHCVPAGLSRLIRDEWEFFASLDESPTMSSSVESLPRSAEK